MRAASVVVSILLTAGTLMGADETKALDHLTSAAKDKWREENLGTQIATVTVMGGTFGSDPQGHMFSYAGLMGQPEQLAIADAQKGELQKVVNVPGADGSYNLLYASSGILYLPSHPNGNLYRYMPGAAEVEKIGSAVAGATFIWQLVEGEGGKIYGACYPGSKLFEYDPATGKTRDLGAAVQGEDYARCIVYDAKRQKLYVGIGSHAGLVEVDPRTGARRSLLPPEYKDQHFVYTIGLTGDQLLVRLDPSNKAFALNIDTGKVEARIDELSSNAISSPAPAEQGGSLYFTASGELKLYDPAKRAVRGTGVRFNDGAKGFGWTASEDGQTSALRVLLGKGRIVHYDPKSGKSSILDPKLPGQPIHLHNIAKGPDGKIYSSGYVVGQVGVYDPRTGEKSQFGNVRQAEGITSLGSKMYFGTYPHAVISVFDTSRPLARSNPQELFRLDADGQDRPFGMLGVPELKKVFIGTVPAYGLLGGTLTVFDPQTSQVAVHRDVVPKQSLVTFAYSGGILYGGTSVYGGLGIEPVEREGKLFLWDVKKGEKIFETVPVAGKRGVSALRFGPDGNLWGWAEGSLFIFDPHQRKVIYSDEKFTTDEVPRHFWRGGFMSEPVDGVFYGMLFGRLYRLDAKTRQTEVLAEGKDLELLTRDDAGALYFVQKDKLLRLVSR